MMSNDNGYKTPQEEFWAGEFGSEYIGRNDSEQLLASNLNFFTQALNRAGRISSCLELGANIGMNLKKQKCFIKTRLSRKKIKTGISLRMLPCSWPLFIIQKIMMKQQKNICDW